jgi:hypothetical protein
MKPSAKIERINGRPVVSDIDIKAGDESVEWSIADSEETEFEISIPPGRDPLESGPNISKDHKLQRRIKKNPPKGRHPYKLKLLRTGEQAGKKGDGLSGPEMIVE